jgi:hypothetical protein
LPFILACAPAAPRTVLLQPAALFAAQSGSVSLERKGKEKERTCSLHELPGKKKQSKIQNRKENLFWLVRSLL